MQHYSSPSLSKSKPATHLLWSSSFNYLYGSFVIFRLRRWLDRPFSTPSSSENITIDKVVSPRRSMRWPSFVASNPASHLSFIVRHQASWFVRIRRPSRHSRTTTRASPPRKPCIPTNLHSKLRPCVSRAVLYQQQPEPSLSSKPHA